MLLHNLVRMGEIIQNAKVQPVQLLKLITDNNAPQARNFLTNVIIIEIDFENDRSSVWPLHKCGTYIKNDKKEIFLPDVAQSMAYPFLIPSGGNPLHPQGRYAIPSYPVYDRHFKDFAKDANNVKKFLTGRLLKTDGYNFTETNLNNIADSVNLVINNMPEFGNQKHLGIMSLLVLSDNNSIYSYTETITNLEPLFITVGQSQLYPNKYIIADTQKILDRMWEAKFGEGGEYGSKDEGTCVICGKSDKVVSGYNKALFWLPITWEAPLSFGNSEKLIEGLAFCQDCYSKLSLGANLFSRLSQVVDRALVKDVFSPATSAIARTSNKSRNREELYGSLLALPLLDDIVTSEQENSNWAKTILASLPDVVSDATEVKRPYAVKHLQNITGFTSTIPEDWLSNEEFRLSLVYFSGDPSKLNIYFRGIIEEIVPSTVDKVTILLESIAEQAEDWMEQFTFLSEKSINFKKRRLISLTYVLSTAFGAAYVWSTMEKTLKKIALSETLLIKNFSRRLNQLGQLLPDSIYQLQQESIDYMAIMKFLYQFNSEIAIYKGGDVEMKSVKELIDLTWETPIEKLHFDNIDELGFATGQVVQKFSTSYYQGNNKKDFIKHRVLTFGSSLTPEIIRNRALGRMEELTAMLDLKVSNDLFRRVGVVSMGFVSFEDEIQLNKDRFMSAFWAGYSLGRKKKDDESANTNISEEVNGYGN